MPLSKHNNLRARLSRSVWEFPTPGLDFPTKANMDRHHDFEPLS